MPPEASQWQICSTEECWHPSIAAAADLEHQILSAKCPACRPGGTDRQQQPSSGLLEASGTASLAASFHGRLQLAGDSASSLGLEQSRKFGRRKWRENPCTLGPLHFSFQEALGIAGKITGKQRVGQGTVCLSEAWTESYYSIQEAVLQIEAAGFPAATHSNQRSFWTAKRHVAASVRLDIQPCAGAEHVSNLPGLSSCISD